jgi:predicted esterase
MRAASAATWLAPGSFCGRRFSLRSAAFALLLLLGNCEGVGAQIVIMKDGFALQGVVKRETGMIADPGGLRIPAPTLGGFFWIDDGPRRIALSHKQIQDVSGGDRSRGNEPVRLANPYLRLDHFRLPPGYITEVGPWSPKWDRTLKLNGRTRIDQHLSLLTSHYAKIEARRYNWTPHYLVDELNHGEVRSLLYNHPDLKLTGSKEDAGKRFRVYRFFFEAGWFEDALTELARIESAFPDQSSKVETARRDVQRMLAAQAADLLDEGHRVGRHDWVQAHLADINRDDLDDKAKQRMRALQSTYETSRQNQALAQRYLQDLVGRVKSSPQHAFFTEAAQAISAELNPDTVERLEAFLRLAESTERNKEGAGQSPEEILALAVTGWLHGNQAAETKVEAAERLWRTRQFVLGLQRAESLLALQELVANYQREGALPFDELAQLIHFLPPPEPYTAAPVSVSALAVRALPHPGASLYGALVTAAAALSPPLIRLHTNIPGTPRKGPDYVAQLPPEYHPGRLYPVLFVLHDAGEKPEDVVPRWSRHAARNGYFLVASEWDRTRRMAYDYTSFEQAAVTDVLRDLFRRFQVDPDRVFVAGHGEGGNMAYDVGLAHPDLFAGVVPISGRPRFFARTYWHNAQYLPFYVVDGDADGDVAKDNRSQFDHWIPKGYPALYVQYKGRGHDWFDAEYPRIFDWMNRKKRATALPDLGRSGNGGAFGEEFQSMRQTDNRFYWVGLEQLLEQNVNDRSHWSSRAGPATLQGHVGEGNKITLNAHGFKTLTLWFRQGMVDFEKPVTITLNMQIRTSNHPVTPSLETLLEDFFLRGDRHRLYLAKVRLEL